MSEIFYKEKDGKILWNCGCVSYPKMVKGKKIFYHEACGKRNCLVVDAVHGESAKKGIPVQHYRAEDIRRDKIG